VASIVLRPAPRLRADLLRSLRRHAQRAGWAARLSWFAGDVGLPLTLRRLGATARAGASTHLTLLARFAAFSTLFRANTLAERTLRIERAGTVARGSSRVERTHRVTRFTSVTTHVPRELRSHSSLVVRVAPRSAATASRSSAPLRLTASRPNGYPAPVLRAVARAGRGAASFRPSREQPFAVAPATRIVVHRTRATLLKAEANSRFSAAAEPAAHKSQAFAAFQQQSPASIEQLAEQVMRHIDRRVVAARERLGRI
jgi:hypothetical protein